MTRRARFIAALIAIVVMTPVAATTPVVRALEASSEPPKCAYKDVLTAARQYDQWTHTLLDTIYRVPRSYAPGDLRSTGVSGGGLVRSFVVADLRAMFAAARNADAQLTIRSSYRSYATQVATFNGWVAEIGWAQALLASARPGHSEHQLGTTIDVTSYGGKAPWDYADWGATKAGTWMRNNAWRYGFVMSYPKGLSPSITCYKYEPWHFRYVGKPVAKAIRNSGVTSRQWFWNHPDGLVEPPPPPAVVPPRAPILR